MAGRTEVVRCQVADAMMEGDKGVVMLIFPDGGNPRKCSVFTALDANSKAQDEAIAAIQRGEVTPGQWRDFTIFFTPAGKGEFRNIKRMGPPVTEAEAWEPPPRETHPRPALPGEDRPRTVRHDSPARRMDATGISIERQVAGKAATEIGTAKIAVGKDFFIPDWDIWFAHIIARIQGEPVPGDGPGIDDEPEEPDEEAAPTSEPELVTVLTPFDPESRRAEVLAAAGGNGAHVNEAMGDLGYPAFGTLDESQVDHLLEVLKETQSRAAKQERQF